VTLQDRTPPAEYGYQAERTVLAHWRTQLACLAVTALTILRSSPGAERWVVSALAGAALAVVVGTGVRRQRRLLAGATRAEQATVLAITGATAVLQVSALVVVL
jgi:hypothetical protein